MCGLPSGFGLGPGLLLHRFANDIDAEMLPDGVVFNLVFAYQSSFEGRRKRHKKAARANITAQEPIAIVIFGTFDDRRRRHCHPVAETVGFENCRHRFGKLVFVL